MIDVLAGLLYLGGVVGAILLAVYLCLLPPADLQSRLRGVIGSPPRRGGSSDGG